MRSIVDQLRRNGYETDLVSVPFKWHPKDEILAHAAAWRLLDLSESNGRTVDLVITTKFPTYFVRHANKVVWLVHQHRAAYELCGTVYSDFAHTEADVGLRNRLQALDRRMLGECRRRFTISANIAGRLQRFNGLDAEPLHPPPPLADRLRHESYGSYVLSVARLETVKRVDLAIDAMRYADEPLRLVVVGEGTQSGSLRRKTAEAGLEHRVEFVARVSDDELVELYAHALAVVYPPFDEDYGYVTLEAFLARKPVVTATDSGGTLAFVEDGVSGLVCEPHAEAIGAAFNALADRKRAAASRARGRTRLGLAPDEIVFAALGGVTFEKRLPQILRALAAVRDAIPSARLVLVGDEASHYDVMRDAEEHGVADRVVRAGYVEEAALGDCLAAADVCLCLRWPSGCETSASWLRCLAAGKPTVVTDLPHLGEIPALVTRGAWTPSHLAADAVTVSIDLLDEDRSLAIAMRRLALDAGLRRRLGERARAWWRAHHRIDAMAKDYERVLALAAARPAPALPADLLPDGTARTRALLAPFDVSAADVLG